MLNRLFDACGQRFRRYAPFRIKAMVLAARGRLPVADGRAGSRQSDSGDDQSSVQVLQKDTDSIRDCLRQSRAFREQEKLAEAETLLQRGLGIDPNNIDMLIEYAVIATQREDWPNAVARWGAVLAAQGGDGSASAHRQLGLALRRQGEFTEAEEVVRRGLASFPDDRKLLTEFAELARQREDWSNAADRWQVVLDIQGPEASAKVYRRLSQALRFQGAIAKAEEVIQAGRKVHPAHVRLLAESVEVAKALGDWRLAIARWELLVDAEGGSASAPALHQMLVAHRRTPLGEDPAGALRLADAFGLQIESAAEYRSEPAALPYDRSRFSELDVQLNRFENIYFLYTRDACGEPAWGKHGMAFLPAPDRILDQSDLMLPRKVIHRCAQEAVELNVCFFTVDKHMCGGNMYHVVYEHACNAYEAMELGFDPKEIFFLEGPWPWARFMVEHTLGFFQELLPDTLYFIRNMYVVSNVPKGPHIQHSPGYAIALRQAIERICRRDESLPRKIYQNRLSARKRRIENEEDLINTLERHGYVSVDTAGMAPIDQLQLFHNADYIVAPHGAGLSNLVACRKGTRVAEIFNNKGNTVYQVIANCMGLQYAAISDYSEDDRINVKRAIKCLSGDGFL